MRLKMRALALSAAVTASGIAFLTGPIPGVATADPVPAIALAPVAANVDVPVTAVTLYSSGVGYFQHSGVVNGNATAVLPFKIGQINDVLKSLVLEDKGGQVTGVTYASQDPLAKILKSFQVDITDNPSLDQLLNQLRGAKVTLALAAEQVSGTILGVEKRTRPAGENRTFDVPVLNVFNGTSVRPVSLLDIRDIRLDNPELQDELTKALAAVASSRDQDKRPVSIHFQGQGQRQVMLGYIVETPIWKTSYRLVLGDKENAQLQGWAIVENQTDNDWNNVQLSLVSGRPISFIEDLYQPLYVQRPTLVPDLYSSLRPRTYEESNAPAQAAMQPGAGFGGAERMADLGTRVVAGNATSLMTQSQITQTLNATDSVIAAATAAKLGELFQYSIGNVSLPRQSSSMIPIVTDSIHAERVSIYNQTVMPRNPLVGARLKNTTGKHLLGGPITILDAGAYAGDAQIASLPPDQDRLICFGIDLQMVVDTHNTANTDDILTGKIVNGVLEVTHKYVSTTVYDAQNKSDHDKTLIIEHPVRSGWDLVDTPAPAEKTDALYRFQQSIPTGKSGELTVKEQEVVDQGFVILDGDPDSVIAFSRNGPIPKDVKDALAKAADIKRGIVSAQAKLDQDKQNDAAITEDQKRINETLRTIDKTTQLYSRLLAKLNDQETQLESIRADRDAVTKQLSDLNQQLRDYLANLNLG